MPKHEEDVQKDKEKMLESLKECSGIVTFACEKVRLSRQTFVGMIQSLKNGLMLLMSYR